jgi:hypothetical protein
MGPQNILTQKKQPPSQPGNGRLGLAARSTDDWTLTAQLEGDRELFPQFLKMGSPFMNFALQRCYFFKKKSSLSVLHIGQKVAFLFIFNHSSYSKVCFKYIML